jgi:NTE family protein
VGLRFDYPWKVPIFFQGSFNYNRFNYNTSNPNFFFEDLKPSYIIENEFNFRFDVGIPRDVNGVIKGGLGIGNNREVYYMNREFTTEDTSDISNVSLLSAYVATETNTLDNKQFATVGMRRKLFLRAGYGIESYTPGSTSERILDERLNYFWMSAGFEDMGHLPLTDQFKLGYYLNLQATFKPLQLNYLSSIIEAPVFRPNIITRSMFMREYRAHQFIAAGLMPLYTINQQIHARMEAYAFFPVREILADENNNAYLGNYFERMKTLFNASLNIVSPAGPVGFHVGYITEEEKPWVVQLSFGYLLFNKRSTDE